MNAMRPIALLALLMAGAFVQVLGQGFTGHAYLEGRNFMRNGVPFYPIVMNYSIEFMTDDANLGQDTAAVLLSPAGAYDMNYVHIECDDQPECDAQLLAHFAKLQSMGFNTIRLTGQRLRLTKDQFGAPMLSYGIRLDDWYVDPYLRPMVGPTFTDPWSMKFFDSFKRFLDLATSVGMNVIFLVSPASVEVGTQDYYAIDAQPGRDLVAQFLTRLTEELHLRPSLMAIDLLNEPIWVHTDNHLKDLTKQQVCDITTQWYDAVHAASAPHPLVTLGGYGATEAGSWDPAVMKLDFYSAHVYPEPTAVTDHDVQAMRDRVLAELHWIGSTCTMPWIVGESAFSADDDTVDPMDIEFNWGAQHLDADPAHHKWPFMHGSEAEQLDFADAGLTATRQALGSGYSWWGFQNDRFGGEGTLGIAVQIVDKRTYLANFWGVLKYGNEAGGPAPWDIARPWRDKLVVSAFQNADESPISGALGTEPANYFNWHWLTGAVINSGTVRDQNNLPVSHGIVEVAWPGYVPDDSWYDPESFFDRIPLNASGQYEIRQAPPLIIASLGPTYTPPLGQSRTTKLHVSGGESIPVPHIMNATLSVEVDRVPFEHAVQGVTYGLADDEELTGLSTVVMHDVVTQGNGTTGAEVDARARDAVHIMGETHFQKGSEVHLWTGPTFPDCSSGSYHMMIVPSDAQSLDGLTASRAQKNKQVELSFELPAVEVLQDAGGTYALFISHGGPGSWQVFDGSGKLVWVSATSAERVQCGTAQFARGEFTVLWQSGNHRSAKRFIVP
jgi:hypothetical protein